MKELLDDKKMSKYDNVLKLVYVSNDLFEDELYQDVFDEYGNYSFPTEMNLIEPNRINGLTAY